jgi:hypothetical protein
MHHPNKYLLWLLVILFCISNNKIAAQSITLYTFPPAHPYHWNNPHRLLLSTLRNYYFGSKKPPVRLIGHMVIELKKDSERIFTGIVADDISNFKQSILNEQTGLAVLFKLVPGHLEKAADIQKEVTFRTQDAKAAFIRIEITDSAYQYLKLYIDSFNYKGYHKLYNGLNRPRAGEGSGCTAFGISFLELIHALNPEYKDQWAVKVKVPEKLIGDTIIKKSVHIRRIFFTFRWARKNEPCRLLTLYEPGLIYRWINHTWDAEQRYPTGKYQLKKIANAKGLLIDGSSCVPSFPMFER